MAQGPGAWHEVQTNTTLRSQVNTRTAGTLLKATWYDSNTSDATFSENGTRGKGLFARSPFPASPKTVATVRLRP
jgi:hypothetical protein